MFWKRFVQDYLTFSKKERIVIISILIIVLSIYFIPRLFIRSQSELIVQNDLILGIAKDSLEAKRDTNYWRQNDDQRDFSTTYEPKREPLFTQGELFEFDPNTLSVGDWQRLGLNEKTAKTIINYRSKGGKFYKPEDLMRIWGMPEGFYERVKDYITITSIEMRTYPSNNLIPYSKPETKSVLIDINEADTSALIALPGIGSKLAARIINFRDKLGGFYSVDQVGETYGVPDSTFQRIKTRLQVNLNALRKLNINTATKDELKVHPYIKWNLANAIVEYRNQHGTFKNLEDLKNIALVDEITFKKIVHYLSL